MNFEQNRFGHPFNPGSIYFNDLSVRIQQRIGIEATESARSETAPRTDETPRAVHSSMRSPAALVTFVAP